MKSDNWVGRRMAAASPCRGTPVLWHPNHVTTSAGRRRRSPITMGSASVHLRAEQLGADTVDHRPAKSACPATASVLSSFPPIAPSEPASGKKLRCKCATNSCIEAMSNWLCLANGRARVALSQARGEAAPFFKDVSDHVQQVLLPHERDRVNSEALGRFRRAADA